MINNKETVSSSKDKKNAILPEVIPKVEDDIGDFSPLEEKDIDNVESDDQLLPATILGKEVTEFKSVDKASPLIQYLREVSRYPLLSREQELILAKRLKESGDIGVAKSLVKANLRLVVKIAMEYRFAYKNVMDLIQEGNIGLMKAVSKYDPDKGAKLSYYASWWIKSYILKFILDNFRMVKIGTTNEQKKLFYNLLKEKERLIGEGIDPSVKLLSENLGVSEKSVKVMEKRLGPQGGELSIDAPVSSDSTISIGDSISDDSKSIEDDLSNKMESDILKNELHTFLKSLKDRDQEIFKKRLLSEVPMSLQAIADEYGVSRERIRQIEERLLGRLKVYMSDFIR